MEQFLQVGAITSTHGIRGEVKVFPTTDDPARFKKLKKVILDTGKRSLYCTSVPTNAGTRALPAPAIVIICGLRILLLLLIGSL